MKFDQFEVAIVTAPEYVPKASLRYAEVYSADRAKIGSLARVQPQESEIIHVDVGGFLTVEPQRLALKTSQLQVTGDTYGVIYVQSDHSKLACLTLLQRQKAQQCQTSPRPSAFVRWCGTRALAWPIHRADQH